jgi:hypothetical protein
MTYLERLDAAWKQTLQIAEMKMATAMQIDAINDLRESEFGYGSDCRLQDMWRTYVDNDGDIVMVFEQVEATSYKSLTTISIDQDGVLTIKDDETGDIEVCDPMIDGWNDHQGNYHPMWYLPERFLKKLCIPSLDYYKVYLSGQPIGVVRSTDNGRDYLHCMRWDEVQHVYRLGHYDGPLSGIVRVDGRLCHYSMCYEDDISRERIYTLTSLGGWSAFKVHTNQCIYWLESKLNRMRKLPGKWIRFPRFGYKFPENVYGYLLSK